MELKTTGSTEMNEESASQWAEVPRIRGMETDRKTRRAKGPLREVIFEFQLDSPRADAYFGTDAD